MVPMRARSGRSPYGCASLADGAAMPTRQRARARCATMPARRGRAARRRRASTRCSDRRRRAVLEDRAAARARRARLDGAAEAACATTTPADACQFCAIGASLQGGPHAWRARRPSSSPRSRAAARALDGVEQLVLTTGTPAHARSRRRAPGRVRARDRARRAGAADPGAVRAARRLRLVRAAARGRRRHAGHAPRGGRAGGARAR